MSARITRRRAAGPDHEVVSAEGGDGAYRSDRPWSVRLESQEHQPHSCLWSCLCRAWIVRLNGKWVGGYAPGRVHPGGQDGWRRALDSVVAPERAW